MTHLDWYLQLNSENRQKGFCLALSILPDPQKVARQIIPAAVELASKSFRAKLRREGDRTINVRKKSWKTDLTAPQLYQIGILEAIHTYATDCRSLADCPISPLALYLESLTRCTLPVNSFYVAVGFEGILSNGSAKDISQLYSRLSPDTERDEKSVNEVSSKLHAQIREALGWGEFQVEDNHLKLADRAKNDGDASITERIDNRLFGMLSEMFPWETNHPSDLTSGLNVIPPSWEGLDLDEMSKAHVCMDHEYCVEQVKSRDRFLRNAFNKWRLPIPSGPDPIYPQGPTGPQGGRNLTASEWHSIEEEIMKEILWTDEKKKRGLGSTTFEVVVDNQTKDRISTGVSAEWPLSPAARYLEIRDPESKIMLANCHLMDPHDLPASGCKKSIELPSGARLKLVFMPSIKEDQPASLSMKVSVLTGRAWTLPMRKMFIRSPQPSRGPAKERSFPWIAIAVSLSVALLATVIALYAQWRVNQTLKVTTSNVVRENVFMDSAAAGMRYETLRKLQEMETNLPRIMHGATFKTRTTLGSAFTYAEQFDNAVGCYEKAKEINPDDPEPYLAIAAIRKIQGRHEESARNLETVLEQQPGNAKAWNYLGWIYFILGRDEKAREAYERALRIRPDYADALFNIALIEQQQGNSKSYAALLERSRALLLRKTSDYPEYAEAHFHLAKVLAHENEPEQALNHLKIAITIDGDFAFWARYEPFFKEIIKAHPEGEKAITAVADIYVANKITQILTAAGLH